MYIHSKDHYNEQIMDLMTHLYLLGHDEIRPRRLKIKGREDLHQYSYRCKTCRTQFYIHDVTGCETFVLYENTRDGWVRLHDNGTPYAEWSTNKNLLTPAKKTYCLRYRSFA